MRVVVGPPPLPDRPISRRALLVLAAAAPAVLVGLCACIGRTQQPTGPDELEPLLERARADAALAAATAAAHAELAGRLTPVAEARAAHAQALQQEVLRARPDRAGAVSGSGPSASGPATPSPTGTPTGIPTGIPTGTPTGRPTGTPSGAPRAGVPTTLPAVLDALDGAAEQAATAAVGVPRYRAGLVGSVAACCAGHAAVLR